MKKLVKRSDVMQETLEAYCHACLIIREEIVCRFFIHLLLVGRGICLMQIQM